MMMMMMMMMMVRRKKWPIYNFSIIVSPYLPNGRWLCETTSDHRSVILIHLLFKLVLCLTSPHLFHENLPFTVEVFESGRYENADRLPAWTTKYQLLGIVVFAPFNLQGTMGFVPDLIHLVQVWIVQGARGTAPHVGAASSSAVRAWINKNSLPGQFP